MYMLTGHVAEEGVGDLVRDVELKLLDRVQEVRSSHHRFVSVLNYGCVWSLGLMCWFWGLKV